SVTDNALLLNALVAYDREDSNSIKREFEDFTRLIGKDIQGKKIGIPTTFYFEGVQEEIISAIEKVIKTFENLGAETNQVDLLHIEKVLATQRIIIRSEAYELHKENLVKYPELFEKEVKERLLTGKDLDKGKYEKALQDQALATQVFNVALKNC